MNNSVKIVRTVGIGGLISLVWAVNARINPLTDPIMLEEDKLELLIPHPEPMVIDTPPPGLIDAIQLDDPPNLNEDVYYNPETGSYEINHFLGDTTPNGMPSYMTLDEYMQFDMEQSVKEYWAEKKEAESFNSGAGSGPLKFEVPGGLDRIFGSNVVDIRPQGVAELRFGVNVSRTDNPQIPEKQRRIATFDFNETIQLNVVGNIGDKLKLTTSYNTEATFDFENQMKLEYTGFEDEIIKKIEAGNVSLPLTGSLITGSQSLFGIKTQLQFGRLTVTSVFSQQKGKRSEINVAGGAQVSQYDLRADNYESNRHYFIGHYFRENYNKALASLPNVNSGAQITRIEVWVTNTNNTTQNTRNIIGFNDLGEASRFDPNLNITANTDPSIGGTLPSNQRNNIYASVSGNPNIRGFFNANGDLASMTNPGGFSQAVHYEKVENARMLNATEYTYNARLGFISLNQALNNDEVLAIAYEYTFGGETYQVGEISTDGVIGSDALVLKLLKATSFNPKLPIWDLMMKNVYNIGAYQVNRDQFSLDLWYTNPASGVEINYIPQSGVDKRPLIQLLDMDKLDLNTNPTPDGVYDFVDDAATIGGTINSRNGRVFFPVIEPFGSYLEGKLQDAGINQNIINTIAFHELYDSTKVVAQQRPELNRFRLKGKYQSSSSSEISLNALNVPQGSVTVTAGGVQLTENVDYTVDYTMGRVKIINQGLLESQTAIKISLESNSLFSIQTKRLLGSHFAYRVNEDFNIGATVMNLTERPLTQKVNQGDEPISNTMLGLNLDYRTESQFLTTLVDKLPFYDTKEKSVINMTFEYAHLIPGHSKAVGKDGTSYVDDFEGSQSAIDIRSVNTWVLASTPSGQPQQGFFPEGDMDTFSTIYGMNRANFNWHVIDPLFGQDNSLLPSNITVDMQSNHYMRDVFESEVFPNRQLTTGTPGRIPVLDINFYPGERGPYNFDVEGVPGFSAGLDPNTGLLNDPESRWGGMMRQIQTNDFEAANIEFIQFWMMDPFHYDNGIDPQDPGGPEGYDQDHQFSVHSGGKLYFNLGNVSEDILKDGFKSFENGLTVDGTFDATTMGTTVWGRVPTTQSIVNAFDNDPNSRRFQDIGLDGLNDAAEKSYHSNYIAALEAHITNTNVLNRMKADPSNDNYTYYRDEDHDSNDLDILERYKKYNGLEGNSATSEQSDTMNADGYPTSATTLPNIEDINQDNNLSTTESYFQYEVEITPQMLRPSNVGSNYITDVQLGQVTTRNGETRFVNWYQFKIPVRSPDKVVNNIQDFRSIRFIRMFAKDFEQPVNMRFARLELIRGEWRKYDLSLLGPGEYIPNDPKETLFNVGAINIEENYYRTPIPYRIPPGISREVNAQSTNLAALNEQSMVLEVCNLEDGDARATFRNIDMDMRSYKRLKMFVHAEQKDLESDLQDDDLTVFVRLGTDFNNNYYEYEIPLKLTQWYTDDEQEIWPEANNIDIAFDSLVAVKRRRNSLGQAITVPYSALDGDRRITVVGNPNISDVKVVMIGIRNPGKNKPNPWKPDDGLDKCAYIWVNELRLSDFDERGGWATIATINTKIADLGTVNLAGSYSTPGWGSIEKRVSERQREEIMQVDASTNLELGKFFGEKANLRVPFFWGYTESWSNPQFDPLNPDQEFRDLVGELDKEEIRKRKRINQTYMQRRSLNFTNVRKERNPDAKKQHFYDVSNFSASYAYNQVFMRDINTEYNTNRVYRGGLNYAYNAKPTLWKPFSKSKFLKKSRYLRLIRDANLYLGPKQLGFRTDIMRSYTERETRINTEGALSIPQFTKQFQWNRIYDFKYDLTKALKVDFAANNAAIVGEPDGKVDGRHPSDTTWGPSYQSFKDSVWRSIRNFGETTNYNHTINVSYTWPINKFPLTDWITLTTRYSGSYDWQRAPFAQDTLGNVIQNSRNINWSSQFNMTTLYNKIPYLKKVNQKYGRGGRRPSRGGRGATTPTPNPNDSTDKKKSNFNILEQGARILMSLKNVSVIYSTTDGMMLPGYNQSTYMMGQNQNFNAPGWGFVFGEQNEDLRGILVRDFPAMAAENGWLVKQPNLNTQYANTHTDNLNARATFEPLSGFKIELNANRNRSNNTTSFFRWGTDEFGDSMFVHDSPLNTGNLSLSVISWNTAFAIDDKDDNSPTFEKFKENREIISQRLGDENPNSTGENGEYYDGYGGASQDVMIPAFIAAYTGSNPNKVALNPLKVMPAPNWRINFDGLSKNEWVQKWAKNITLNHAYRSSFSISSFTSNLNYGTNGGGASERDNIEGNFIPELQISNVTMTEQFSPLINVDITLKNDVLAKVELKRDRNLSLSFSNLQMTEVRGNEIVIGTGYRMKDVKFPWQLGGKDVVSDLKVRADINIRRNLTITRDVDADPTINRITAGQTVISIKTSADYSLNDKLQLRAFFDRVMTRPAISTTFPTANTSAGIALRFTLAP